MSPPIARRHRLRGANHVHRLNTVARIVQPVAATSQDLLVADLVQLGKAFGEFQLFTVDVDAAVGGLLALDLVRQVIGVNGEEPAYAGAFVFQVAGGLGFAAV